MPATAQYITSLSSTSGQSTYTFNNVDIGDASNDRIVVLCIETRKTGTGLCEIISSTIGGVTANVVEEMASAPSGTVNYTGIISANVPSGGTADISFTFSVPVLRVGVQVYSVKGSFNQSDSSNDDHPSVVFDLPKDSVVIGCLSVASSQSFVWDGLTEDYRDLVGGASRVASASEVYSTEQLAKTIGVTRTSGTWSGVVASFASWGLSKNPPENLSPPTLSINNESFTGSVGLWDAMGFGPLSYYWELRDTLHNVIASGTGTNISGSGIYGGEYYLRVTATSSEGSLSVDSEYANADVQEEENTSWGQNNLDIEVLAKSESERLLKGPLDTEISVIGASKSDRAAYSSGPLDLYILATSKSEGSSNGQTDIEINIVGVSISDHTIYSSNNLDIDVRAHSISEKSASSSNDYHVQILAESNRDSLTESVGSLNLSIIATSESPPISSGVFSENKLEINTQATSARDSLSSSDPGMEITVVGRAQSTPISSSSTNTDISINAEARSESINSSGIETNVEIIGVSRKDTISNGRGSLSVHFIAEALSGTDSDGVLDIDSRIIAISSSDNKSSIQNGLKLDVLAVSKVPTQDGEVSSSNNIEVKILARAKNPNRRFINMRAGIDQYFKVRVK